MPVMTNIKYLMIKFRFIVALAVSLAAFAACDAVKDGEYELTVVSTGDGHGNWFSEPLSENAKVRGTIMSQSAFVNGIREKKGAENVLLVDVGDNLLGSDEAFYYSDVDASAPHLYPRLASYMGYDAIVAGHADFETGHGTYDRVAAELKKAGIPFLAGNAVNAKTGKPYFLAYKIVKKGGIKVAVLGYTNSDVASLVDSAAVSGISFKDLTQCVQADIDMVRKKEKPQAVVVVAHTGIGREGVSNPQRQGLELFQSLRGADVIIAGHDHSAKVMSADSVVLVNSGKGGQSVGVIDLKIKVEGGQAVSKSMEARTVSLRVEQADSAMIEAFKPEFETVKDFANAKLGNISKPMVSREFYSGQCDYMNFLHSLALSYPGTEISLGATLLIDGTVPAGDVRYCDIPRIYPFENKIVLLSLSGEEIRKYLEASYNAWIQTAEKPSDGVLKLKQTKDYATKKMKWKLDNSPANFDSAAGICYTVDVTKPFGQRVTIKSMADGTPFEMDRNYVAAITSYRSSGSGRLLQAAGLDTAEKMQARVVGRGPEFRTLLYNFLKTNPALSPEIYGKEEIVGSWSFTPDFAKSVIESEVETLYGKLDPETE